MSDFVSGPLREVLRLDIGTVEPTRTVSALLTLHFGERPSSRLLQPTIDATDHRDLLKFDDLTVLAPTLPMFRERGPTDRAALNAEYDNASRLCSSRGYNAQWGKAAALLPCDGPQAKSCAS